MFKIYSVATIYIGKM